ncbi:MAG: HD domain-containing protein [Planctomycetota bacterium]
MPATDAGDGRRSRLGARWLDLLGRLGAREDEALRLFERVADAYSGGARRHHDLRHVEEVLEALRSHPGRVADRDALEAAALFHDIVYDPEAEDNEERSAELAARELRALGVAEERALAVHDLVAATKPGLAREPTGDAAVLVDADMSVLGADEARYDKYARAIRGEYAFLPSGDFKEGRTAFLRTLLSQAHIFNTSWFRERLEAGARANVAREIARLVSEV